MFFKFDSKLIQQQVDIENRPISELLFGLFKDLNAPFETIRPNVSSYPQFSPIRGINNKIIKNLRLHGHYAPQDKGFPRPKWDGRDPDNFPQNWTASLLEFIAPSYIGFLFDSVPSTPFHDWLKPKNIALIFNAIIEDSFYDNSKEGVLKLAKSMQPEVDFQKLELEENKRLKLNQKGPKYGAFSKLKSLSWPTKELPFAEILFEALNETKGTGHIVALILLSYMWDRKKSKLDLKPFYDNLSNKIIQQSDIKTIVWEKKGSFYTERDYVDLMAKINKNPDMVLTLENKILLKLGHSYYRDPFPIKIDYGVSILKLNGKWESFSDCGEISLLNYFMMALYDPYTKHFSWEQFEELKKNGFDPSEKLIFFFKEIYTSPIYDFTQEIRTAWADVLSNLNKDSFGDPIVYLKNNCCIAPGLDNMAKVMRALFQPPMNNSNLSDVFLDPLNLLKLKRQSNFWEWSYKVNANEPHDLTLSFYYGGFPIFEWHFQNEHFDFNRIEHSKQKAYSIHYLDKSNILQIPEIESADNFSEELFGGELNSLLPGNLDSIEGKAYALYKIFCFKNKFKSNAFDYLIDRWLEPSGKYFSKWEDVDTNKAFIKFLTEECKLSKEAIVNLNIPQLTAHTEERIENLLFKSYV